MPRRRPLLALLLLAPFTARAAPAPAPAPAPPAELRTELPAARLQGEARMRYFGLHVYDARLWVAPGFSATGFDRQAFALELTYARRLEGRLIAERSLAEMRRLARVPDGQAQSWLDAMTAAFPDVAAGDRITGVLGPDQRARFYVNGRLSREVADPAFGPLFFGIWLSPRTSEPGLREALLAGAEGAR